MEGSRGCAHVILMPIPVGGHCLPYLHFAARLAHLGLRVTFLVGEGLVPQLYTSVLFAPYVGLIQREGIEVVPVKDGFSHLGVAAGLRPLFVGESSSESVFVAAFREPVAALMASTAHPAPCCIVSDMLMGWTQALAKEFNIPRFVLHTQSAANLSLMLHVPTLLAEGRLPLTATNQDKPVDIPGLKVPLATADLPSDLHPYSIVRNSYETFLKTSRWNAEAPIVLVNTFRELEADVFAALDERFESGTTPTPKVIPVGPLHLPFAPSTPGDAASCDTNQVENGIVRSFLATQPRKSVLYISFGTVRMLDIEKLIQEIALGLEASGQPFLWTQGPDFRDPNAPTLSQLVPPGFLERTKERGLAVNGWEPQVPILQHPAIGAFLSHCGWNSILESISVGLPILAWPLRAEQRMNARYLVEVAKVAAEFKPSEDGTTTGREIARVVRLVMQQPEGEVLRSNVQSLKEAAAKNAASFDSLKTFLGLCEDLCSHSGRCCTSGCI